MSKSFEEFESKINSLISVWGVHATLELYRFIADILYDVKELCDEKDTLKRKLHIISKNNAPLLAWIDNKLREEGNEKKGQKTL